VAASARTAANNCAAPWGDGRSGAHPVAGAVACRPPGGVEARGGRAAASGDHRAPTSVGAGNANVPQTPATAGTTSPRPLSVARGVDSSPAPLPHQGTGTHVAGNALQPVEALGATSPPHVCPTLPVPELGDGASPTPLPRSLVVAPVMHLHGGMQGEVTAALSAGYEENFDIEDTLTPSNLVGRLFLSSAADANRMMCLGCLLDCADAKTSSARVATPRIAPLPTGEPPRRTPVELSKERDAYLHVVTLAQYAQMSSLSARNVKPLVMQGVHLAETGQHANFVRNSIKVINTWAMHTVSGATSGVKQTMLDYVASIEDFCNWTAATPACQPDGVIVPVNRHVAVAFLELEKDRERSTTRRPPKHHHLAPPPPPRGSRATSSASAGITGGATSGGGGGSSSVFEIGATGDARPSASPSAARPGAAPSSVNPKFVAGGAPVVAASTSAYLPPPVVPPPPEEQRGQATAASGKVGEAVNVDRGWVGRGGAGAHGSTAVAVRGRGANVSDTPVVRRDVTAHPSVGGRRARAGGRGEAAAIGSPVSDDAESGTAGNRTTETTTPPRKVGHSTLKMNTNALSKVASVFSGLWSQCSCGSCSSFGADAFLSVRGRPAAKAVVEQCKRERYLEATALGVGKATGTRYPALPDDVRLPMVT